MWHKAVQANEFSEWEQRDLTVQVDANLRRAYPEGVEGELTEPLLILLEKLKDRATTR